MMQKLKKRRPSETNQRTAQLSVTIPPSVYAPYPLDSATSRGTGGSGSAVPLAGLQDLSISQGDFRGSVIIDSLSKRFSVLRAKASPIRPTFPNFVGSPGPYTPQLAGIDEIRQRLAAQRQRAKGKGRYVAEEEENLVLEELAIPEDNDGSVVTPMGVPPSSSDNSVAYRPSSELGSYGSRTYGFGATSGMKEAEVLMRAHTNKRSVSDKSLTSATASSRSGTPSSSRPKDQYGQAPVGNGKRKSLLAMLPVETQERITNALMEIEEDLQAEALEASMVSEQQPSEMLIADADRGPPSPRKSSRPVRPQHQRQNSSITRSPFRENLAQIAKGIEVDEAGSETHSRTASPASIPQPDFTVKRISTVNSAASSRHSSRRGHSRAGSSIDLNRFRFGSGLAEGVEDVSNAFSLPPQAPPPTTALPPVPTPPPSHDDLPHQEVKSRTGSVEQSRSAHQRTPSASAAPIPIASLETGYVPGSARPFAASRSESPLELVGNHAFGNISPVANGSRAVAPPLVRKVSKVIPPNRPGPLMLQPTLMPRSVTASSLPSVSPVVETFADSAARKGYNVPGPYTVMGTSNNAAPVSDVAHSESSKLGSAPVGPNSRVESPLDVSFDIDGYYGAGRSPVEPITRYPSATQSQGQATDLLQPPSNALPQPVRQQSDFRKQPSLDSLRSTFSESSTDLPSPALYAFPNLSQKRVESGSLTPPTDFFGSDDEGDGDDGKQELFDELQAMQERLLEAAREVRRGLNAGTPLSDRKRKDVSPSLRTRPSIRARKPEPSMYSDMGDNVSQLVRAMSPRQPSDSSFRQQITGLSPRIPRSDTTSVKPSSRSALTSDHLTAEPRGDSPASVNSHSKVEEDNASSASKLLLPDDLTAHPSIARSSSTNPSSRTLRAPALLDSTSANFDDRERPRRPSVITGHTGLKPSPAPDLTKGISEDLKSSGSAANAKTRPEDDLELRRDFEARIANATAQLKSAPSLNVKRRPSTKGGAAMYIGTPTLINSSSNLKVTPLPTSSAQYGDKTKRQTPPGAFKHTRHQSSSAANGETGGGGGGLKAFVAKIKRNASLAERKRLKTPGSSPRIPQDTFQPSTAISPKEMNVNDVAFTKPVYPVRDAELKNKQSARSSHKVLQTQPEQRSSRRSIVRRTIILSASNNRENNHHDMEAMPNTDPTGENAAAPSRRPSTRRKPVRHLSGDTDLFRAEGLLVGSQSQSISQVISSAHPEDSSHHRKSATDSLYDMYADIADEDRERDDEEIIYTGVGSSFTGNVQASIQGAPKGTKPRAIEIREMSDGQTTWSLIDSNDPLIRGLEPSSDRQPSNHLRNVSLTSSLSSYGRESLISRGSGLEGGNAEITHGGPPPARPKTNIFYSHETDVAELIDDLSRNGFEGKFRIVSPSTDRSEQLPHDVTAINQDSGSTNGAVEKKLQVLMQRMLSTSHTTSHTT